jgi:DNA-directed RNA polymerase III subunit RPC4
MFAQEVVAIDTREKHCSSTGELGKCAIVTPDIDYLLDSTHLSMKE